MLSFYSDGEQTNVDNQERREKFKNSSKTNSSSDPPQLIILIIPVVNKMLKTLQ